MNYLTTDMFADALRHVCDLVIASEPKLTELDNIVGDGDHGDGMRCQGPGQRRGVRSDPCWHGC